MSSDIRLRPLDEHEIQDTLYGEYHTGRRRHAVAHPVAPPPALGLPEAPWDGTEILKRELARLTHELQALRQERERLAARVPAAALGRVVSNPLSRAAPRAAPSPAAIVAAPMGEPVSAARSGRGTWLVLGGVLLIAAALGAGFHVMVLEANPSLLSDGRLYSVQVGVYDVKPLAARFVDMLSREGHPAFLVEQPRHLSRPRYRVYVGQYASRQDAQAELAMLQRHPLLNGSFILKRR